MLRYSSLQIRGKTDVKTLICNGVQDVDVEHVCHLSDRPREAKPFTRYVEFPAAAPISTLPASTGEGHSSSSGNSRKATSSHQLAQIFVLANAAKAMAAAAVRFLTSSLHRMCSTCLQIVPVHALRITPIS